MHCIDHSSSSLADVLFWKRPLPPDLLVARHNSQMHLLPVRRHSQMPPVYLAMRAPRTLPITLRGEWISFVA